MSESPIMTSQQARLLIDRLVTGDLEEPERRSLLVWLDEVPERWRMCGRAFLEAQVWGAALTQMNELANTDASVVVEKPVTYSPSAYGEKRRMTSRLFAWGAAAAALFLGFAGGLAVREGSSWHSTQMASFSPDSPQTNQAPLQNEAPNTSSPVGEALFASIPVRPDFLSGASATLQIPVMPANETPPTQPAREIPEHVRRQWEQRGYRVWQERRYLSAKLANGRPVMVPIDEFRTEYVGVPIN